MNPHHTLHLRLFPFVHRASHAVRWMWASHVVHHTPEQIHLANGPITGTTAVAAMNVRRFIAVLPRP